MDLASFFGTLRGHYVGQLQAFTAAQRGLFERGASEARLQMRPESAIYRHLYRADFVGDSGEGPCFRELVPDDALAFDRVTMRLGLAYVSVTAMSWDDCVITHDLETGAEAQLQPALELWFGKWFERGEEGHLPETATADAVHSVLVSPGRLSTDLGTAPVEALIELLELLVEGGALSIGISGSRN